MKSSSIQRSTKVVGYGITPILPLRGFPEGKTRIRMRSGELVKIRVRSADGIRSFVVEESEGAWVPLIEEGVNATA